MDRTEPLHRRQPARNVQQCRRARHQASRAWKKELSVLRVRRRRPARRLRLHPPRNGQDERHQPAGLPDRRPRAHCRPSHPQDRHPAPLVLGTIAELRSRTASPKPRPVADAYPATAVPLSATTRPTLTCCEAWSAAAYVAWPAWRGPPSTATATTPAPASCPPCSRIGSTGKSRQAAIRFRSCAMRRPPVYALLLSNRYDRAAY